MSEIFKKWLLYIKNIEKNIEKEYWKYQTRKHLVEPLILSKINCCNVLFKGLPKSQMQRINKLLRACAGFVKYKYGELKDIAGLKIYRWNCQKKKDRLRKNSVMLVHQNQNIKPAYLEEANKVFTACGRYFVTNCYSSANDNPSKTMIDVFYFI